METTAKTSPEKSCADPCDKPEQQKEQPAAESKSFNRRQFVGGLGGAAAMAGGLTALGSVGSAASSPAEAAEVTPFQPPVQRRNAAFQVRHKAALAEKARGQIAHPTNGDEETFPSFIGNFTKTMPHNNLGEVDPVAYQALVDGLEAGSFAALEAVAKGGTRTFLNPLGGLTFTMEGPDSPQPSATPPPSIASAEWAAQLAELYWMALLRDVPFSQFDSHPLALDARADLAAFSGYTGPRDPVSGAIGANHLFRLAYPGVTDGPMGSQFIYAPFSYDGIPIVQKVSTAAPGEDFITTFDEFLSIIRGFPGGGPDPRDPVLRFVRNVRDLGRTAGQDRINSQYFKASIILGGAAVDAANPYNSSSRQDGFATFGTAHLVELIGKAHKSERHSWYHKWFVHRFLRPEAGGARVDVVKRGLANYPIHPDLVVNSTVLDAIFERNRQINLARLGINQGSYLLPQMFRNGSPTHPSFPAGHAITAGACVTILKAWFDGSQPFPNPKKPTDDGLALEDYVAGVDGPVLTFEGELNKLCHNLSIGRDMSGVHWRADDVEGNLQGEEVAIRILNEEVAMYPESFAGFTLRKFDGTTIVIDGTL